MSINSLGQSTAAQAASAHRSDADTQLSAADQAQVKDLVAQYEAASQLSSANAQAWERLQQVKTRVLAALDHASGDTLQQLDGMVQQLTSQGTSNAGGFNGFGVSDGAAHSMQRLSGQLDQILAEASQPPSPEAQMRGQVQSLGEDLFGKLQDHLAGDGSLRQQLSALKTRWDPCVRSGSYAQLSDMQQQLRSLRSAGRSGDWAAVLGGLDPMVTGIEAAQDRAARSNLEAQGLGTIGEMRMRCRPFQRNVFNGVEQQFRDLLSTAPVASLQTLVDGMQALKGGRDAQAQTQAVQACQSLLDVAAGATRAQLKAQSHDLVDRLAAIRHDDQLKTDDALSLANNGIRTELNNLAAATRKRDLAQAEYDKTQAQLDQALASDDPALQAKVDGLRVALAACGSRKDAAAKETDRASRALGMYQADRQTRLTQLEQDKDQWAADMKVRCDFQLDGQPVSSLSALGQGMRDIDRLKDTATSPLARQGGSLASNRQLAVKQFEALMPMTPDQKLAWMMAQKAQAPSQQPPPFKG